LASFSYILLIRLRRFIGVRRLKNEVLRRCSKDMPIQITVMMGSAKGSAFAEELSSFLREHGYQVQVFPGIFQDSNFRGISHHAQEGKNMIGVGHIPF
jgi:phage terminase large subunit-like protein